MQGPTLNHRNVFEMICLAWLLELEVLFRRYVDKTDTKEGSIVSFIGMFFSFI